MTRASKLPESCSFANLGRRFPELAPEGIGEVTVTGETEFERDRGDIAVTIGEPFQRRAKTKLCEITMDGHTGLLLKYAREVKR